jgi:hypothetical protein
LTLLYRGYIISSTGQETQEVQDMSEAKRKALETLARVKQIYEDSESELLCAGFYDEFMEVVNNQIKEIEETTV